jgi:hypothetical protein
MERRSPHGAKRNAGSRINDINCRNAVPGFHPGYKTSSMDNKDTYERKLIRQTSPRLSRMGS